MKIRLLKNQDLNILEKYLAPHKVNCMFICSNLKAAGIDYNGNDFEGEYFGYFDQQNTSETKLLGVIVHYWNGNIMMHSENEIILERLITHLAKNISKTNRPIRGILGPDSQAEFTIQKLDLANNLFNINSNEGLYELKLTEIKKPELPETAKIVSARDIKKDILIDWMKNYDIEALGTPDDETLKKQVENHWNERLQTNENWVLLIENTPVAFSAFNARLPDMVQVGPVWTPKEHRNRGFARLLLAYTLHQEKQRGIKQAILFTNNPAAIKAYNAIGFKKIGNYRLALLNMSELTIEFSSNPKMDDINFLTQKINQETPDFGEAHPFAFFIRDNDNKIIAGCNGSVVFGTIYTDQLWVAPNHRHNRLGHKLMTAIHDYGRKLGCSFASVATMDFQKATDFCEKMGYISDFERTGYIKNSRCIFFKRDLM